MRFSNNQPSNWQDLQNKVASYLNGAGYKAAAPHIINTARGKVEVDVYVDTPDELIKNIICECKFWDTPVTKEKVHAFRTVVYDSGAALGLLISKRGFQKGAIDAAKYSNVMLVTWDEFLKLLSDKWIISCLTKIKTGAAKLRYYTDRYSFPSEKLNKTDYERYDNACKRYAGLAVSCWIVSKSDLIYDNLEFRDFKMYSIDDFSTIDTYLEYLSSELKEALDSFEDICKNSNVIIPENKLNPPEGVMFMYLH